MTEVGAFQQYCNAVRGHDASIDYAVKELESWIANLDRAELMAALRKYMMIVEIMSGDAEEER